MPLHTFFTLIVAASAALAPVLFGNRHQQARLLTRADTVSIEFANTPEGRHAQKAAEPFSPTGTLTIVPGGAAAGCRWSLQTCEDSAIYKMCAAQGGTSWRAECFAAGADRAIVWHADAAPGTTISALITLTSPSPHRTKASGRQLTMTGHTDSRQQGGVRFCHIAKAEADSAAAISATDGGLAVTGATSLTLCIVGETAAADGSAPYIETAADDAWHLVNCTYEQIRARHTSDACGHKKHAPKRRKARL